MNQPEQPAAPRQRARQAFASLRDGNPSPSKVETEVSGPYKDRDNWRPIVIEGGKRRSLIASTRKEAARIKARLSEAIIFGLGEEPAPKLRQPVAPKPPRTAQRR